MSKRLARVRVREMDLDERQPDGEQSIPQGYAGCRERGRIEDGKPDPGGRGAVDPADEIGLRIALERDQLVTGLPGLLSQALLDGVEGIGSVNPRLPAAEQVQVGSV